MRMMASPVFGRMAPVEVLPVMLPALTDSIGLVKMRGPFFRAAMYDRPDTC
jgi:hypothetical protein